MIWYFCIIFCVPCCVLGHAYILVFLILQVQRAIWCYAWSWWLRTLRIVCFEHSHRAFGTIWLGHALVSGMAPDRIFVRLFFPVLISFLGQHFYHFLDAFPVFSSLSDPTAPVESLEALERLYNHTIVMYVYKHANNNYERLVVVWYWTRDNYECMILLLSLNNVVTRAYGIIPFWISYHSSSTKPLKISLEILVRCINLSTIPHKWHKMWYKWKIYPFPFTIQYKYNTKYFIVSYKHRFT